MLMNQSLEGQLQSIRDKSELHRWVDTLPEGSRGILILEDPDGESSMFHSVGSLTACEAAWLVDNFKIFLLGKV